MSHSNRNSITYTWLAAGFVLLVLVGYFTWSELRNAEPTVAHEYESSRYADRAQDRINRICIGLVGVELLHCEYEVEQPERENYRAQKDLRAQWYMAIWAGFMTFFTFGTLIVTGLGVYFVRMTLNQAATTNEAALDAATAALEANKIMREQSAGYLTIEKVEIQTRRSEVFVYATVKNIGQRPVRRATIKGTLKFVVPLSPKNGVPDFRFINVKTELFAGVVEAGQQSRALSMLAWNEITEDYETYEAMIYTGVAGVDFDCSITWADSVATSGGERHILHPLTDQDVLDPSEGEITTLTVGYSGMPRDHEEKQAKQSE